MATLTLDFTYITLTGFTYLVGTGITSPATTGTHTAVWDDSDTTEALNTLCSNPHYGVFIVRYTAYYNVTSNNRPNAISLTVSNAGTTTTNSISPQFSTTATEYTEIFTGMKNGTGTTNTITFTVSNTEPSKQLTISEISLIYLPYSEPIAETISQILYDYPSWGTPPKPEMIVNKGNPITANTLYINDVDYIPIGVAFTNLTEIQTKAFQISMDVVTNSDIALYINFLRYYLQQIPIVGGWIKLGLPARDYLTPTKNHMRLTFTGQLTHFNILTAPV